MNRFYLVTSARLAAARSAMPTSGPAHARAHWRVSWDGTRAIIQGEISDVDHAALILLSGVTPLGAYLVGGVVEKAVRDYLAANRAAWDGQ